MVDDKEAKIYKFKKKINIHEEFLDMIECVIKDARSLDKLEAEPILVHIIILLSVYGDTLRSRGEWD